MSRAQSVRCWPASCKLMMVLRHDKAGTMTRPKAYYHRWLPVVHAELGAYLCTSGRAATPLEKRWGLKIRGHSLGGERLSGSKTFLYKATLQRLRDMEGRLGQFKVPTM